MKELSDCLKRLNLVFTDTLSKKELLDERLCLDDVFVDYENSINLYDIVYEFNRMYQLFKNEYNKLDKLDLGKRIRINKFSKMTDRNYRVLSIFIDKPNFTEKDHTVLYFTEDNGLYKSFITNDINPFSNQYYFNEVFFDKSRIKDYLDLFEKYELLLYLYYHFQNEMICGDGTHTLATLIPSRHNNILDDLDIFKFMLGLNYFLGPTSHITIETKLGKEIGVNVKESKLELNEESIPVTMNGYLNILKSIYINERYLNTYWDREDHAEKVTAKSLKKIIK